MTIRQVLRALIILNALQLGAMVTLVGVVAAGYFQGKAGSGLEAAARPEISERVDSKPPAGAADPAKTAVVMEPGGTPSGGPSFDASAARLQAAAGVPASNSGSVAVMAEPGLVGLTASRQPDKRASGGSGLQAERGGGSVRQSAPIAGTTKPVVFGAAVPQGGGGGSTLSPTAGGGTAAAEGSDTTPAIGGGSVDDSGTVMVPEGTTSVPAAWEEMDPEIAKDPVKREEVEKIREEFVDSIRNPDGSIPENIPLNEWMDAQWIADEKYRALFGHEAWNAQQRRAAAALAKEFLGSN